MNIDLKKLRIRLKFLHNLSLLNYMGSIMGGNFMGNVMGGKTVVKNSR